MILDLDREDLEEQDRCVEYQGFIALPVQLQETARRTVSSAPGFALPDDEGERWLLLQGFVALPER